MSKHNHPIKQIQSKYTKKINYLMRTFSAPELIKFIDNSLTGPNIQLDKFFKTVDEYLLDADKLKYERSFLRFVTDMECFRLRINDKNRKQRIWNPLDESFEEFAKRTKSIEYYYADTPYPPREVIIEWLEQ